MSILNVRTPAWLLKLESVAMFVLGVVVGGMGVRAYERYPSPKIIEGVALYLVLFVVGSIVVRNRSKFVMDDRSHTILKGLLGMASIAMIYLLMAIQHL
jgi:hypothetical protein